MGTIWAPKLFIFDGELSLSTHEINFSKFYNNAFIEFFSGIPSMFFYLRGVYHKINFKKEKTKETKETDSDPGIV